MGYPGISLGQGCQALAQVRKPLLSACGGGDPQVPPCGAGAPCPHSCPVGDLGIDYRQFQL